MTKKQQIQNSVNIQEFLDCPINTYFMYLFDIPFGIYQTDSVKVIGENGKIYIKDCWDNSKVFVVNETKVTTQTLPLYLNKTIMGMYIKRLDYLNE